ncbi:YceD family protein [Altererythrobacter sp. GH1-8]|uniref:YceD family protein n=1 Tax=Altererythrobacter sp. GH1-8 TaxID=3349333 RepID=UPI00374D38E0
MSASEFSRFVKVKPLHGDTLKLEASDAERAALAARFGLPAISSLVAEVELEEDGKAVRATGVLRADIIQACAISGDDFTVSLNEPLALRFVEESLIDRDPALEEGDIEIELDAEDLDEMGYSGESFDLGEAIAQSLGLAIDPYAEGPNAEAARKQAGITGDDAPTGPLAEALAALKKS